MQFNDNVITEITAPNNVPFEPGFDIIGFGTEIPPELAAIGVEAAIIFYSDNWDPNATTPKVKFFYLGTGDFFTIGICYSDNPSTTPAHVTRANKTGMNASGAVAFLDVYWNSLLTGTSPERPVGRLVETVLGGAFQLFSFNGSNRVSFQAATAVRSADIVVFDHVANIVELFYSSSQQVLAFNNGNNLGYGAWVACTYANGWAAVGAPSNGRRSGVAVLRHPDGTIQMTGVATGGTSTPGTYIVQLPSSAYWPRFGTRVVVDSGNAAGQITIEIDSGNGAVSIRGPFTAAGETNFETSWTTRG